MQPRAECLPNTCKALGPRTQTLKHSDGERGKGDLSTEVTNARWDVGAFTGNKEDRQGWNISWQCLHILVVNFFQNCQNMEATQVASNSWADKQTGSYTE